VEREAEEPVQQGQERQRNKYRSGKRGRGISTTVKREAEEQVQQWKKRQINKYNSGKRG